ncbi:MAG: aminotransferase class V-fold PLP-dependent enzyme [Gammaproteobacteria bacterium]|nr:aminotransferase class V-fold PLP-dependent enzyme [Gammaproteobacteria bacterium]
MPTPASLDLTRARADTPGTAHCVHLNNAGAALPPTPVLDAVKRYLDLEAVSGGYEAAMLEAEQNHSVYTRVATLIGAGCHEVAICESATVAWDRVFYSMPFQAGDRVITAQAEYGANYVAFLQQQRRLGIHIDVAPCDGHGAVDVEALERMLDDRVKLIAITWIPTNGGLVNPAAEIGAVARRHGIPYLLDACQAVGQMPVDVQALGCDMLTATGRKFLRAPRGTGFLYVRNELLQALEPWTIDHAAAAWVAPDRYQLRKDALRFETWEKSIALRRGLAAAVDYALDLGLDPIRERAWGLAEDLRERLRSLRGVQVHDSGAVRCAIVSFSVPGADANKLATALRVRGFNLSVSDPSSTLLDSRARQLPPLLRASPHYYNSETESDAFIRALHDLIAVPVGLRV